MAKSVTIKAVSFILREFVGEVLFFPVWWYSEGLRRTAENLLDRWRQTYHNLGLKILFKNMGKPMYGDYSRSGRLISFFMRLFLVGAKLVGLFWWSGLYALAITGWVVWPLIVGAMLLRQFIPQS